MRLLGCSFALYPSRRDWIKGVTIEGRVMAEHKDRTVREERKLRTE